MLLRLRLVKPISGVLAGALKANPFVMEVTREPVLNPSNGKLMKPAEKAFAAARRLKINPCAMDRTKTYNVRWMHKDI